MSRMTFAEHERRCELSFQSQGPWWHLYTPGKLTTILLTTKEDFVFMMNLLARCCNETEDLVVVAFEMMSNHIHIVLACTEERAQTFFAMFKRRLARYLCTQGIELPPQFQPRLTPITDLKTLRNEIVYVHRNGYVVDPNYTPFSYPWGTGRYYYSDVPIAKQISDFTKKELRRMLCCGDAGLPGEWQVFDGYVAPISYCAIKLGMRMFRDAHHYFAQVSKNVEAYSGIAAELDDGEFLTDAELFNQLTNILKDKYAVSRANELSKAQKLDIARTLHYDYRSSNGQIRRVLGLSQYEVDSLFPLSKSKYND